MPKQAGRAALLKIGGVTIAALRTISLSWNGTTVDVTDQSSSGIQEFLDGILATDVLQVTASGLEEDGVLRKLALKDSQAAKFIDDMELVFPTGDSIDGNFVLTSYTENEPYDNAVDFNSTFVRNGAHTWTDAV